MDYIPRRPLIPDDSKLREQLAREFPKPEPQGVTYGILILFVIAFVLALNAFFVVVKPSWRAFLIERKECEMVHHSGGFIHGSPVEAKPGMYNVCRWKKLWELEDDNQR